MRCLHFATLVRHVRPLQAYKSWTICRTMKPLILWSCLLWRICKKEDPCTCASVQSSWKEVGYSVRVVLLSYRMNMWQRSVWKKSWKSIGSITLWISFLVNHLHGAVLKRHRCLANNFYRLKKRGRKGRKLSFSNNSHVKVKRETFFITCILICETTWSGILRIFMMHASA